MVEKFPGKRLGGWGYPQVSRQRDSRAHESKDPHGKSEDEPFALRDRLVLLPQRHSDSNNRTLQYSVDDDDYLWIESRNLSILILK